MIENFFENLQDSSISLGGILYYENYIKNFLKV